MVNVGKYLPQKGNIRENMTYGSRYFRGSFPFFAKYFSTLTTSW